MESALALVSTPEVKRDEMFKIFRALSERWNAYAEGGQIGVGFLADQSAPEQLINRYSLGTDDLDPSP